MAESLSARNIVKHYGGVVALSDGNLDVQAHEVVALIGANGSGKSTMSKVINGVVVLDGGQLLLDGSPVQFSSPQAARKMGIATVFQELSLIPQMTVAENIWLTREPLKNTGAIDRRRMNAQTGELLALFEGTFKTRLHPDDPVASLPPDEKQIIEVLKAISADPWMLILDEATASLDSRQVQRLFELVAEWKQRGKAVVFISHRMEEIFRIADNYSVLRNGRTVGSGKMSEINEKELVRLMMDADLELAEPADAADEIDSLARSRIVDPEDAAEHVPLQNGDVQARHRICLRQERGMRAAGRLGAGQVRSLLNDHLHAVGVSRFMDDLCSMADAMLWDTRVLWAANGVWPSEEDRYAADLGLVDIIGDPFVREFTQAVLDAPIPIVTGGHALVSGGLWALLDSISMDH